MKLPVTSPQIAVRRFKKAHCGVAACGARRRTFQYGLLRSSTAPSTATFLNRLNTWGREMTMRFEKAHCGVAACGARRRAECGVLRVMHRGFTSLELLIALSLLMLLAVAATPIYSNFYVDTQHRQSQVQLVNIMRLAQQFSQGRVDGGTYGVYLDIQPGADQVILYQGDSYVARNTALDRVYVIDEAVSLSTTFTDNEIIFDGKGVPAQSGTITLTHATQGIRTISLNARGLIDYQ